MKRVYKFTLEEEFTFKTPLLNGYHFNSEWVCIDDGWMIIRQGYSWDGCSPKFEFLDMFPGTPDGKTDPKTNKPITYYASGIHDALYQYKRELKVPRHIADLIFFVMLVEVGFSMSLVYYLAVRAFGGFYGKWGVDA